MAPHTEFTLWLTPRDPRRSLLRSTIHRLAEELDAVEFEPHVTVYCGQSTEEEASAIARRVATGFGPLELTAVRLDHTERYTKTLFVQFEESTLLREIFEVVAASYALQSDYVLNPHLSLLYKKLPANERRKLCQSLDVPMGNYRFDRVRMIETELPIEDDGPVRRWRVVCDQPLGGPSES